MTGAFDAFSPLCPSRSVVDDVTDRWPALVLIALLEKPHRFAEAARTVGGISDRMLSRTLTTLVADGLVVRTDHGEQHVEYELSASGHHIATALKGVVTAVYDVMPEILQAKAIAASA
ncbi:MAG TPA: helix-turn-helix domain-containing protein [Propionicimonas sp.]|nr:helix-turn-helix domain-containing protein [Propionicimonas sp.]